MSGEVKEMAGGHLHVEVKLANSEDSSENDTLKSSSGKPGTIDPADLAKYRRIRIREFVGDGSDGAPIMFERIGEFLSSGNCKLFTIEEWVDIYIWDLERHFPAMREASIKSGKPLEKYIYFGDVGGIVSGILNQSIWKVIPLLKALVGSVEEYYPEIVHTIVLFNVPRIATIFYSAVKLFLDPVTAAKIELHTGVPTARFRHFASDDAIPKAYGGTSKVDFPKTAKK